MKSRTIISIIIISALTVLFARFNFNTSEQPVTPYNKYSQVKVNVSSRQDILNLQQNDITVEHYTGNFSEGITLVINQDEMSKLQRTGIPFTVEIPDMDEYYKNRPAPMEPDLLPSKQILQANNIDGFNYGSMGGYYTYSEVVLELDSMRMLYPGLITAKMNIGTTHEARTIWAVKISDNADVNESATEPAIYFDALHHAREPQAMASLMYFMYWLLENYNTNPEAKHLVDNREIFIVPVANPDGYVYNQTTNPNGGGMWRKNRRNNGGCFGVDLNRNYPYGWGYDNGSSNNPCSDTYRGPSAGSEPESQAIRNFILPKQPKIGFSVHSVAGRYLNPYGYTDTSIAYEIYSEFSSDFSSENDYLYGTVKEMLNYYSSGTTRDWLHTIGCYAWTPEVGGSGFWPSIAEIIPIANENLAGFRYLSWVGGAFASFQNYQVLGKGYVHLNDTLTLQVGIKNKGLSKTAKNVTVDITTTYPNITPITSSISYDSIPSRQIKYNASPFRFKLTNAATYMNEIKLVVSVKQENAETTRDTIFITVGKTNVLLTDNAENGTVNWTKSGNQIMWDTSFCDYFSEGHSFADSRYGNSKDNTNNQFTLNNTINLAGTVNPRIEYYTKWASELNYDYTRIQVSTNNGATWINLGGRYTSIFLGQPSYHGNQSWVQEQVNLNPYIGQQIKIRFTYFTDSGIPGDGFYFDNFRVLNYTDTLVGIVKNGNEIPKSFALYQNYPNPFNPVTKIKFDIPVESYVNISVYDITGKIISQIVNQNLQPGSFFADFDASGLSSGVYFYNFEAGTYTSVKKMMFVK